LVFQLSESESESSATSPEKSAPVLKLIDGINRERIEEELKRIELEFAKEKVLEDEKELDRKKEVEFENEQQIDIDPEKEEEVLEDAICENEKAADGTTKEETEVHLLPENSKLTEKPEAPVLESSEEAKAMVVKKISKQRKESERKKRKREEYRKRKIEAAKKAAEEKTPVAEIAIQAGTSSFTAEPIPSPYSTESSSPKLNGEASASSPESSREEDITAKESVLGALGLQSTRLAQQERPKVPKLKLVVRPTPAKKKGHRSETGNEKTYAICHEVN